MEINNKKLLAKIGNIQKDIGSLIRDELNKFQNYKYFEESQILKILKPALGKQKLTLILSDDDTQPLQYEREGNNHFIRYLKKLEISDQESGETNIYKFWACGSNSDLAKAKGSAETYATKYILSKLFLIRVIDDNDPELIKPQKTTPAEQQKKVINEKALLRDNAWWCKRCETDKDKEPYKLVDNSPNLDPEAILKALVKHGEIRTSWK